MLTGASGEPVPANLADMSSTCLPHRHPLERTLLYFTIAGSDGYVSMFRLLLLSLRQELLRQGPNVHVLCLVHPLLVDDVVAVLHEVAQEACTHPPEVQVVGAGTVFEASTNKLLIASYANVSNYDRVVYMDVDMVAVPSRISLLLTLPLSHDTVHGVGESGYDINHEYFSLGMHNASMLALFRREGQVPISAGLLMFRPTARVLAALSEAYTHAMGLALSQRPLYCMEQPILNHVLQQYGMVDGRLLTPYVVTDFSDKFPPRRLKDSVAVVHLTGLSAVAGGVLAQKVRRAHTVFMRLVYNTSHEGLLLV